MKNYDFGDYDLDGLSPNDQLPPRAELASFEPKGVGTPYCESLLSYFLRLADIHHVSPQNLARKLIFPLLSCYENEGHFDRIYHLERKYLNGLGVTPEQWVNAMEQLTGQKGLDGLTLLPLRQFLSNWRLLGKKKKWCPICLFETSDSRGAYDQLIWEIDVVDSCPKHEVKLVNQCECENVRSIPFVNMKHLPGVCKYCGRSLGHNNASILERASIKEIHLSKMVAELLEDAASMKHKTENIAMFLHCAVNHLAQGEASRFARMVGVRKNTLHYWLHGNCTPNLEQIVNIASICKCAISEVLIGSSVQFYHITDAEILVKHSPKQNCRMKITKDNVYDQLLKLAAENPPITVTEAAKIIGVSERFLRKKYQEITAVMVQNWRSHRKNHAINRLEHSCSIYRECAIKIANEGRTPTRRLVGLNIDDGSVLKIIKRSVIDRCNTICREVRDSYRAK